MPFAKIYKTKKYTRNIVQTLRKPLKQVKETKLVWKEINVTFRNIYGSHTFNKDCLFLFIFQNRKHCDGKKNKLSISIKYCWLV